MSASDASVVPGLRALLALAIGIALAFTSGHSAAFALVTFGIFALPTGAVIAAGALTGRTDPASRGLFLAHGVITAVAGVAALVLPAGGVHYYVLIVSGWATVTGALELVSGIRARRRLAAARDSMILGGLTLLLAIVFLIVPPDYRQSLGGIEQIKGQLTASVVLVGLFNAWAIISGVLLAIAAVPARRPRQDADSATSAVSA